MADNSENYRSDDAQTEEKQKAPTSVQPIELKDAVLSGGMTGAQQQALRLNGDGRQGERRPEIPAGQHATGSFTDSSESGPAEGSPSGKH